MTTVYRYRKDRHFAQPPETIWPFVADTARLNEIVGGPVYRVDDRIDGQGRTTRLGTAKAGPMQVRWQERFGEWQENKWLTQERHFKNGPFRHFKFHVRHPDGAGSKTIFSAEVECVGALGVMARLSGRLNREFDKRIAAIESLVTAAQRQAPMALAGSNGAPAAAGRRRFDALIAELDRDPASHGLAPKLKTYLLQTPTVELRGIRPLALARSWQVSPADTVELFLAAQQRGLLAMGWDLLCPRCRGAKSRVERLHELPRGAHCSSCNINYGRDFTRNVELTFHPESWFRPLPEGELCMLGQGATPHVKLQAEVAARASKNFALTLAPGAYRFRTVEAGGEADADIGADGAIPQVTARGADIILILAASDGAGELTVHNDTDRALYFVIEDRKWTKDALTGERVIAMPAFRRLCPEQLLRPGDDVEIGRVAIMFTDLQGSTKLYDELGDAQAYRLVRDHFAFLSERVQRHNGFIVKTIGDAVMAAFGDPADAVRAALAIRDDVASFNRERSDGGGVLKLGLHLGACIAVTAGGVLDYFGSAVNTASRLEHQCRGGEVIVSSAVLADGEAREALAGRTTVEDQATLRGLREPVPFVRIGA